MIVVSKESSSNCSDEEMTVLFGFFIRKTRDFSIYFGKFFSTTEGKYNLKFSDLF